MYGVLAVELVLGPSPVESAVAAADYCTSNGMVLASQMNAVAAWEMGQESCTCGWVSDGWALELVRNSCAQSSTFGAHNCTTTEGSVPFCMFD